MTALRVSVWTSLVSDFSGSARDSSDISNSWRQPSTQRHVIELRPSPIALSGALKRQSLQKRWPSGHCAISSIKTSE
jgi:hypothetical protein